MKSSFHSLFPLITAALSIHIAISRDSLNYFSAGLGSSLYSLWAAPTENIVSIVIALQYMIVACLFVAAGICLPSRCLAVNVSSGFQALCHSIKIAGVWCNMLHTSASILLQFLYPHYWQNTMPLWSHKKTQFKLPLIKRWIHSTSFESVVTYCSLACNVAVRTIQENRILHCCWKTSFNLQHTQLAYEFISSCSVIHSLKVTSSDILPLKATKERRKFLSVVLLLHSCMLRALPSNGRCLQSHCLATPQ
jgi:hypothetical protein